MNVAHELEIAARLHPREVMVYAAPELKQQPSGASQEVAFLPYCCKRLNQVQNANAAQQLRRPLAHIAKFQNPAEFEFVGVNKFFAFDIWCANSLLSIFGALSGSGSAIVCALPSSHRAGGGAAAFGGAGYLTSSALASVVSATAGAALWPDSPEPLSTDFVALPPDEDSRGGGFLVMSTEAST